MLRPCYRYITILSENSESEATMTFKAMAHMDNEKEEASGFDLKILRAIRVLRPLKLVSGVPSKSSTIFGVSNRYTNFGVNHYIPILVPKLIIALWCYQLWYKTRMHAKIDVFHTARSVTPLYIYIFTR